MHIAFLVDTSASMNQRNSTGISYLDLAKNFVEQFLRARRQFSDHYFLVSCDAELPYHIGWFDPPQRFSEELKNLKARDLSILGVGIKRCFDLLNQFSFG